MIDAMQVDATGLIIRAFSSFGSWAFSMIIMGATVYAMYKKLRYDQIEDTKERNSERDYYKQLIKLRDEQIERNEQRHKEEVDNMTTFLEEFMTKEAVVTERFAQAMERIANLVDAATKHLQDDQ